MITMASFILQSITYSFSFFKVVASLRESGVSDNIQDEDLQKRYHTRDVT
jgi:hypothetical protein